MKVFAPVITHDVTLPNTAEKVPMVMVPVPDSRTLMAIPISTLSKETNIMNSSSKDEQQARELLLWNNGIGTLDGCDLHFKINQLGCLELLDSDDELENTNNNKNRLQQQKVKTNNKEQNAISADAKQQINNQDTNNPTNDNNVKTSNITTSNNTTTTNNNNNISNSSSAPKPSTSSAATTNGNPERVTKRTKSELDSEPIRQISPGASLLRDGPNIKRPKASISNSNHTNTMILSSGKNTQQQTNIPLSLLKKIEQSQNSILLQKLVPKEKLDEIKSTENVEQWTVEDVKKFIDSIPGCYGYGELFESQQICGKSLMYLDQKDLLDVINIKLGPAVKIYHAISLLK